MFFGGRQKFCAQVHFTFISPSAGYFYAGQSDTGMLLSQNDRDESRTASTEALWLVYKWESLQPVTFYPAAEQPKLRTGLQFWAADKESDSLRARCGMLRCACH